MKYINVGQNIFFFSPKIVRIIHNRRMYFLKIQIELSNTIHVTCNLKKRNKSDKSPTKVRLNANINQLTSPDAHY